MALLCVFGAGSVTVGVTLLWGAWRSSRAGSQLFALLKEREDPPPPRMERRRPSCLGGDEEEEEEAGWWEEPLFRRGPAAGSVWSFF